MLDSQHSNGEIKVVAIIKPFPHPLVTLNPLTCHLPTPSNSPGCRGLQIHTLTMNTPHRPTLIPYDPQHVTARTYSTHRTLVTRMDHFYKRRQHGRWVRWNVLVVRSVIPGYVPPNHLVSDWNLHTELLSIAVRPRIETALVAEVFPSIVATPTWTRRSYYKQPSTRGPSFPFDQHAMHNSAT